MEKELKLNELKKIFQSQGEKVEIISNDTFNCDYLMINNIAFNEYEYHNDQTMTMHAITDKERISTALIQLKLLLKGNKEGELDDEILDCMLRCVDIETRAQNLAERSKDSKSSYASNYKKYILKKFGGVNNGN